LALDEIVVVDFNFFGATGGLFAFIFLPFGIKRITAAIPGAVFRLKEGIDFICVFAAADTSPKGELYEPQIK